MKRSVFVIVLLGIAVCMSLAAQGADIYHLVVVDRAKCPGAAVDIDEPLFVFVHKRTGYYIIFGQGTVNLPPRARIVVDLTSPMARIISGYLDDPSFKRYVSSPQVLDGLRVAVQEEARAERAAAAMRNSAVYHLTVIDRAKCPGETVNIDEQLAAFAHGKTGYYIVFGKGTVRLPYGAEVAVDLTARTPAAISRYLDDPAFKKYVSSPNVLAGIRFAIKAADK